MTIPNVVVRRHAGDQAIFDIALMAQELALALKESESDNQPVRVLFDWSELTSWPYRPSPQKSIQFWKGTVPKIARAAFVHSRRWDPQAALLAALLRIADAEVRSFSPRQFDDAIKWLVGDAQEFAQ
jgi:hypothetical protein